MAINQSTLRSKAASYTRTKVMGESYYNFSQKKSAFLCHSHKDEELVKGLLVIFEEAGLDLYVDWRDHSMPETPNGVTAQKIQDKIKSSDVFLFLATANSKTSRWCPWEIGFADSSQKGIYIIPTADGYGTYGNEYLQLYPKIDNGSAGERSGYAIFQPGSEKGPWVSSSELR
jgi:TIR domain